MNGERLIRGYGKIPDNFGKDNYNHSLLDGLKFLLEKIEKSEERIKELENKNKGLSIR